LDASDTMIALLEHLGLNDDPNGHGCQVFYLQICRGALSRGLVETRKYEVAVSNANSLWAQLIFHVRPTSELIVAALQAERDATKPAADSLPCQHVHEQNLKRWGDLIEVARFVPEPLIPVAGHTTRNDVNIAGVAVGYVSVTAREAWSLA
jgi:hypothetical protein